MYMWDIHDVRKIGKQWSFLYHSACVFGVETYPELKDGNKAALPAGSFFTCSSDGTIRIWNVDPTMNTNIHKRNIYSHVSHMATMSEFNCDVKQRIELISQDMPLLDYCSLFGPTIF